MSLQTLLGSVTEVPDQINHQQKCEIFSYHLEGYLLSKRTFCALISLTSRSHKADKKVSKTGHEVKKATV